MKNQPISLSIPELRGRFAGQVLTSQDAEYDDARTVVMGNIDRRPTVIIQVAHSADVAEVIALARETGLELAIRSGGHSSAGHSATEGGIVLDVRGLTDLDVNVPERTAWVGAGLSVGAYTTAVSEHGLATGFGDTGSVGVSGITLSGGLGLLVRKYGLAIDNVLAAEIVTANGEVLQIDAGTHPDLFWAIRGGGGNFGVVTKFKFRLQDVSNFVGGMLFLPATADIVTRFMSLAEAAPRELSTILNVMTAFPMPFIPEEQHGKIIAMAMMAFTGPREEGERVLKPFRELGTPFADMLRPMPYAEMFPSEEGSYHPLAVAETLFIDNVDCEMSETIMRYLQNSDAPMRVAQLRVLGGAMADVPTEDTAFAHRSSKIMANVAAFYEGEEDKPARQAWVSEFTGAIKQSDSGAYTGFLMEDDEASVRRAYPDATWDRLIQIKRRYDPHNLFRLNPNIAPAA